MDHLNVNGYTREIIQQIFALANNPASIQETSRGNIGKILGTIFRAPAEIDVITVKSACARLGTQTIDFSLLAYSALTKEEFLTQCKSIDSAADMLITSIIDYETFGNGHTLTKEVMSSIKSPLLSMADDIYASQAALSEIFGLQQKIGDLKGKKIHISWGFGTRFDLPNIAHSMTLLLPFLGADISVAFPNDFELLKRVVRDARKISNQTDCTVEIFNEFDSIPSNTDAVFAYNWSRLDDFLKPDRNSEYALDYRDWYFVDEMIPKDCAFLSLTPVQTDLIADYSTVKRSSDFLEGSLSRRIDTLKATIELLSSWTYSEKPPMLL